MLQMAYEGLLRNVFETGAHKGDRTGTGTRSVFGTHIRYDLAEGFPLITTKSIALRLIRDELLWFLNGDSNIKWLLQQNNHIWSEWPFKDYLKKTGQQVPIVDSTEWKSGLAAFEQQILDDDAFALQYGDLGPVYGVQWTAWPTPDGKKINQIAKVVDEIKRNPNSRRLVVSAWNPADLEDMALEPCHAFFQFYVLDGVISCMLTQRSADMFLGVPFNIASYALLTHMVAQQCGLRVGELIWSGGDTHIYDNHVEQVQVQLSRTPRELPQLVMPTEIPKDIFSYTPDMFQLRDYHPHAGIKAPVAV